jgi:hypothetical protein
MTDFASGASLAATIAIVNGGANTTGSGGPLPASGTDAYATFSGKVTFGNPIIYYGSSGWWVDATFTNLDPAAAYTVVLTANRGGGTGGTPPYPQRWTKWTISSIDVCTNASSAGASNLSSTAAAFCTGENGASGYVAKWTDIRCGSDGYFKVRAEAFGYGSATYQAYGPEAVMLREESSGPQPPSVVLTSPSDGATVGTNITLTAEASDDGAVTSVVFYADGSVLGGDAVAPFAFVWNPAPTGTHAITAAAWDNAGLCATSAPANLTVLAAGVGPGAKRAEYVIHVSVDGLRPDAVTVLGPSVMTNFYRLRTQGAFTDNARNDYDYTVTLPNHTCQLTGRGVTGASGHNWTSNSDPPPGVTLESNKGTYIAGAFDVAHDYGLRTAEYASKSKFSLFATSWDATHGGVDLVGDNNGRNKIDIYVNQSDTAALVNRLVADLGTQDVHYAFLHLTDPDTTGHASGWDVTPGSAYLNTVRAMDTRLGALFGLVDTNGRMRGRTAILVTADHGGYGTDHSDPTLREDYTVPFYVWAPRVAAGADLYALNRFTRLDPGTGRPAYTNAVPPVRNGECANLALKLLGLGPVPGSTICASQNLSLWLGTTIVVR